MISTKRKLVDEVRGEWQVSIRKACAALEFDRSTYHYKPRRSVRLPSKHGSMKSAAFVTVAAAFTSCCAVKVGATARQTQCIHGNWPAIAQQGTQAAGQGQAAR